MKNLLVLLLAMNITFVFGQEDRPGFEGLLYAKAQIEQITNKLNIMSDTSMIYKKYYLALQNEFIKTVAEYEGYKGLMTNCLTNNSKMKDARKCLSESSLNLKAHLDEMTKITDMAICEFFKIPYQPASKGGNKSMNSISIDVVSSIITALIEGGTKVWTHLTSLTAQEKEIYIKLISDDAYKIKSYDQLLSKPK